MLIKSKEISKERVLEFFAKHGVAPYSKEELSKFVDQLVALHEKDLDFQSLWSTVYGIGESRFGNGNIAKLSGGVKHEIFIKIGDVWFSVGIRISEDEFQIRVHENLKAKTFLSYRGHR